MRPSNLGVLVSTARFRGDFAGIAPTAPGLGTPKRPARTLDSALDLVSGRDLVTALEALGHEAQLLHGDDDLDLTLRQRAPEACLLALHGTVGGTGDVQALLTMRGIPYAGPSAAAVALAFDKVRARQMLAYHNLPVPTGVALGPDRRINDRAVELLGWPCVLKPRRGALGVGVTELRSSRGIEAAVDRALSVDHELVLERVVEGVEVQVALLGERVLGAMEVIRDAQGDECQMHSPPRLGRTRLGGIHNLARRAVAALGLQSSLTRVDVVVSDRQNEVVLEVEPLPPLHRDGVVARLARAAGMSYTELVGQLVQRSALPTFHARGLDCSAGLGATQ